MAYQQPQEIQYSQHQPHVPQYMQNPQLKCSNIKLHSTAVPKSTSATASTSTTNAPYSQNNLQRPNKPASLRINHLQRPSIRHSGLTTQLRARPDRHISRQHAPRQSPRPEQLLRTIQLQLLLARYHRGRDQRWTSGRESVDCRRRHGQDCLELEDDLEWRCRGVDVRQGRGCGEFIACR